MAPQPRTATTGGFELPPTPPRTASNIITHHHRKTPVTTTATAVLHEHLPVVSSSSTPSRTSSPSISRGATNYASPHSTRPSRPGSSPTTTTPLLHHLLLHPKYHLLCPSTITNPYHDHASPSWPQAATHLNPSSLTHHGSTHEHQPTNNHSARQPASFINNGNHGSCFHTPTASSPCSSPHNQPSSSPFSRNNTSLTTTYNPHPHHARKSSSSSQ